MHWASHVQQASYFPSAISWMKYTNATVILSSWNTGTPSSAPQEGCQEVSVSLKAQKDQDPDSGWSPLPTCLSCSHPSGIEQAPRGKNSRKKRLNSRDQAFWAMGIICGCVLVGEEPKPKNAFRWDQCGTEPGCPWVLQGSSSSQLFGLPEDLHAALSTSRTIIKME